MKNPLAFRDFVLWGGEPTAMVLLGEGRKLGMSHNHPEQGRGGSLAVLNDGNCKRFQWEGE